MPCNGCEERRKVISKAMANYMARMSLPIWSRMPLHKQIDPSTRIIDLLPTVENKDDK